MSQINIPNIVSSIHGDFLVISNIMDNQRIQYRIWDMKNGTCFKAEVVETGGMALDKFIELCAHGSHNSTIFDSEKKEDLRKVLSLILSQPIVVNYHPPLEIQPNCSTKIEQVNIDGVTFLRVTVELKCNFNPFAKEFLCQMVYSPTEILFATNSDEENTQYRLQFLEIMSIFDTINIKNLKESNKILQDTVEKLKVSHDTIEGVVHEHTETIFNLKDAIGRLEGKSGKQGIEAGTGAGAGDRPTAGFPAEKPMGPPMGHPTGYPAGFSMGPPMCPPMSLLAGFSMGPPMRPPMSLLAGYPAGFSMGPPIDHPMGPPTGFLMGYPMGYPMGYQTINVSPIISVNPVISVSPDISVKPVITEKSDIAS